MKLTLLEKITIPSLLKKEGDFKTIILNKDILEKVKISQDELKEFDIKASEKSLTWNEKGVNAEFEIEFTDFEKLEIKLALQKLDEEKKITIDYTSLYEKFVLNK